MAGACERGNEHSGAIKCGKFILSIWGLCYMELVRTILFHYPLLTPHWRRRQQNPPKTLLLTPSINLPRIKSQKTVMFISITAKCLKYRQKTAIKSPLEAHLSPFSLRVRNEVSQPTLSVITNFTERHAILYVHKAAAAFIRPLVDSASCNKLFSGNFVEL